MTIAARPISRNAFAFVWVTVLIDMMSIGLIMPVVPSILKDLTGLDAARASVYGGWLFFSYAAMQFVFAPVAGALSDAVGRRPILLLAILGIGVDHALTAFSPTITWLFVGRLVAGLFGGSYVTANAYIADVTKPEDRGRAFGILGAALGVGFILGPAIGGLLGGYGDRVPFFVAAGLSLTNFIYGVIVLPETLPSEHRTPFRVKQANPIAWISSLPGGKRGRLLAIAIFAMSLGTSVYPSTWTFYGAARYGWTTKTIGLSLAVYGVSQTVVQMVMIGPLIKRWGEQKAAVIGLVVGVVSLVGVGLATRSWMVLAILVVAGFASIAFPALQATMSADATPDAQGRLQGAIGGIEGLSTIVGPILMTQLFDRFGPEIPGISFFAAAALSVAATVLVLRSEK